MENIAIPMHNRYCKSQVIHFSLLYRKITTQKQCFVNSSKGEKSHNKQICNACQFIYFLKHLVFNETQLDFASKLLACLLFPYHGYLVWPWILKSTTQDDISYHQVMPFLLNKEKLNLKTWCILALLITFHRILLSATH